MISKAAVIYFFCTAARVHLYLLVLYCSLAFFRGSKDRLPVNSDFVPRVTFEARPLIGP